MLPTSGQIVLGTSHLGLTGTREDAFALLDTYVELGGRVIDTAAVYNDWVPGEARRSEGVIGAWLRQRGRPAGVRIFTKGAHPPLADMGASRLDAAAIIGDAEASLKRLGVEQLDLYYLHRDDAGSPLEPILLALRRLLDDGKVAAVGLSNWTSARVAAARATGIVAIASNQVLGNILCRLMSPPADPTIVTLDGGALADAEASDSSLLLFSSQAGGYLSKLATSPDAGRAEYRNPASTEAARRIAKLAAQRGIDPTNLAVRFLLDFSPSISPVIGSRTVEHLRRSMAARDLRIDTTDFAELAAICGFADWR